MGKKITDQAVTELIGKRVLSSFRHFGDSAHVTMAGTVKRLLSSAMGWDVELIDLIPEAGADFIHEDKAVVPIYNIYASATYPEDIINTSMRFDYPYRWDGKTENILIGTLSEILDGKVFLQVREEVDARSGERQVLEVPYLVSVPKGNDFARESEHISKSGHVFEGMILRVYTIAGEEMDSLSSADVGWLELFMDKWISMETKQRHTLAEPYSILIREGSVNIANEN